MLTRTKQRRRSALEQIPWQPFIKLCGELHCDACEPGQHALVSVEESRRSLEIEW